MNERFASGRKFARVTPSAITYFLRHAPFAVAASSLPGAMNFTIILYLAYSPGFEEIGSYRLLFSFYSLVGLASLLESNKLFVRSLTAEDRDTITALFINRVAFSAAAFLTILLGFLGCRLIGMNIFSPSMLGIAALASIIFPLDSYFALLQAQKRFDLLFFAELIKYGSAFTAFIVGIERGMRIDQAMLVQLGVIAVFHVFYFLRTARVWINPTIIRGKMTKCLRSDAAGQARTYSIANMLPSSLEHIDKLLVGWVFGLEFLGIYTLAYSAGRLLYNMMKPALYIYYRRFVDVMPRRDILQNIAVIFTIFGALLAAAFMAAIEYLPILDKFRDGAVVTVILFLAYGIGMVRSVYGQAFVLHKDSDARRALTAAIIATLCSILLLCLALTVPPTVALVLLALQYPLRDGLTVALLRRHSKVPP